MNLSSSWAQFVKGRSVAFPSAYEFPGGCFSLLFPIIAKAAWSLVWSSRLLLLFSHCGSFHVFGMWALIASASGYWRGVYWTEVWLQLSEGINHLLCDGLHYLFEQQLWRLLTKESLQRIWKVVPLSPNLHFLFPLQCRWEATGRFCTSIGCRGLKGREVSHPGQASSMKSLKGSCSYSIFSPSAEFRWNSCPIVCRGYKTSQKTSCVLILLIWTFFKMIMYLFMHGCHVNSFTVQEWRFCGFLF